MRYVNQATAGPRLPLEEYHDRWRRVQDTCRELGLDGVVVWSRTGGTFDAHWDVFYLTNHYSSFPMVAYYGNHWTGRAQPAFILPVDGDPTLVIDIPDHREDLVSVEDVRFTLNIPELVAEVVAEKGLSESRVGLVGGNALLVAPYKALIAGTPGVDWVEVDDLIENMHVVKSPRELELIREASAIGRSIIDAVMTAALKPGTTEAEAVAAGHHVAVTQGAAILQSAAASGPHSHMFSLNGIPAWSDRVLKSGEFFHFDCFGFVNGYQWDFGRGLVVGGDPTGEQREILETAIEAVDAGIAAIRPGVTGAQAYEVIHKTLEDRDMIVDGGLLRVLGFYGHSFGVGWGWPWLFPGDTRPMQAGMTLAVEAMAGRPELGSTYFEQDILITEDGAEVLSTIPKAYW